MYFYAHRERALRCGSLPNFLPSIVLCSHFLFSVSSFFLPFFFFLNYVHIYFLMAWNMQARALEYIENFLIKKIRFWWIVFPFYLWIIIDVLLWYVEIIIIEDFPNILIFWYSLLVWWSLSKKKNYY